VEWDWRDQNRKTGKEGFAEDAIVFELANGKILYWREYIEKKK
jgi:limonene-1,2-epoxide hydrolase